MSISDKLRIEAWFDTEIDLYVVTDLKSLLSIELDERGFGGCAVPLAQTLFAFLDVTGFLLRSDPSAKKSETSSNIYALLESKLFLPTEYQAERERLVKLFRHGVVHQFFPKASGICRGGDAPLITIQGVPVLNVDRFARDVLAAIPLLREHAVHAGIEHQTRFVHRLDRLANEDWGLAQSI